MTALDDFKAALEKYPPIPGCEKPRNLESLILGAFLEIVERFEALERVAWDSENRNRTVDLKTSYREAGTDA